MQHGDVGSGWAQRATWWCWEWLSAMCNVVMLGGAVCNVVVVVLGVAVCNVQCSRHSCGWDEVS